MNVYLDTSVILSRLLGQANALSSWGEWHSCYTSTLTRVEYLRTIDRIRLNGGIDDLQRVRLQDSFETVWEASHRVPLSQELLDRGATAMPTVIGTLDALHLVTALSICEHREAELVLLTHDRQLATAAAAMGLSCEGIIL